jgi:hypothetical protein
LFDFYEFQHRSPLETVVEEVWILWKSAQWLSYFTLGHKCTGSSFYMTSFCAILL